MASEDAALDAEVDRLLLRGTVAAPASSPIPHTRSTVPHSEMKKSAPQSQAHAAPTSSHPQPSITATTVEEEEDLNALVERILAGPLTSDAASTAPSSSSRGLAETQRTFRPSQHVSSPSISPVSSSPRYQYPQPHQQPSSSHPLSPSPQQRTSASLRTASAAAARRPAPHSPSGSGGAVRAEASLARSVDGGLLHTSSSTAAAAVGGGGRSASLMDAVVRRLTLWQERREAKRVQSVYEALEREQEDCTFEPSINRLMEGESRSGGGGGRAVSSEYACLEEEREEAQDEGATETIGSVGRPPQHQRYPRPQRAGSTGSGSTTAHSTSHATSAGFVPSLLPPTQPIYGVNTFVERIRRAQEERDAVKAAEEAQRLRYYDPTTFQRDLTVPEPFELGDTRPRRPPISTAAVAGAPSPLARLRAHPSAVEGMKGMYGLRVGAAAAAASGGGGQALTSCPSHVSLAPSGGAAGTPAVMNQSPFSNTLGPPSPRNSRGDYGAYVGGSGFYGGGRGMEGRETLLEEEEDRMTAENTFLSLAPQIREALLFDQQMEQQLHRATQSIRRGTA